MTPRPLLPVALSGRRDKRFNHPRERNPTESPRIPRRQNYVAKITLRTGSAGAQRQTDIGFHIREEKPRVLDGPMVSPVRQQPCQLERSHFRGHFLPCRGSCPSVTFESGLFRRAAADRGMDPLPVVADIVGSWPA